MGANLGTGVYSDKYGNSAERLSFLFFFIIIIITKVGKGFFLSLIASNRGDPIKLES